MKSIQPMFKQTILFLAFAAVLLASAGCKNTAHGFGQDVERSGEKIQEKTQ